MFNHLETPRSKKKEEEEEKNSVCLQKLQNDESFLFKVRIILDQLSYNFYRLFDDSFNLLTDLSACIEK